jgi:hypothetical protein
MHACASQAGKIPWDTLEILRLKNVQKCDNFHVELGQQLTLLKNWGGRSAGVFKMTNHTTHEDVEGKGCMVYFPF